MWKLNLEVTIIFLWVCVGVGEHFFMGLFFSFFLERPTRSQKAMSIATRITSN